MILRDFRKQIEDIINQSGLPIDAIYFVFKDVYNEINNIYLNEINKEDSVKEDKEKGDEE